MTEYAPFRLLWALGLTTALAAPAVAQEIYRCDEDGVTVFSDMPCSADAEVHVSGNYLSIVAPPDLSAVAEQNRAWIQRQQERMDQRDRERESRPQPPPPARAQWPTVPVFGIFPDQHRHSPRDRGRDRRDQRDETEERFSALSGRQPGARPRRDDP